MRRDLVYYYDRPLDAVFNAFIQAANQRFGKNCKIEQGKTISFALNYSFKYNMNGGTVTAHFMPYQNGTAVNLRYTIIQAVGARYKAHAKDLTLFADGILQTSGVLIQLDINLFLAYEQQTPSAGVYVQSQNAAVQQPVLQQPQPQRICANCGKPVSNDAVFCNSCGKKLEESPSLCAGCGTVLPTDAKFCPKCGAKRI